MAADSKFFDPAKVLYDVSVDDGKYRFVYFIDAQRPMAFRHGEPWPPATNHMLGNKSFMSLVARIDELEQGVHTKINAQQVADVVTGLLESDYSDEWLWSARYNSESDEKRAKDATGDPVKPPYSLPDFWSLGGKMIFAFENPDTEGGKTKEIGIKEIISGIQVMAEKYPHHFADFVRDNCDAVTYDIIGQCMVYGEIIYG